MKLGKWLICLLCLLAMLPAAAGADVPLRVFVRYQDSGKGIQGATFDLYQIADMDQNGGLTLTSEFAKYPVRVDQVENLLMSELAKTLEGYILRDQVKPMSTDKTDKNGTLSFPTAGKELGWGLYLLLGHEHTQDGFVYRALPTLVSLPFRYSIEGGWINEPTVRIKCEKEPENPDPKLITRKALKVWMDEGYEEKRPKEVTVQLLRDGVIYDTQKLNAENNWGFEWENLSDAYEWTLTEKEMSGYSVSISQAGITFVVVNTYDQGIIVPTPTPEPTPEPTKPPKPTKTPRPKPTMDPNVLPQTGQVWWPVPVLLTSGAALVLVGLIRRRGDDDED